MSDLPFTLVGHRHVETGVLSRMGEQPREGWEPVFTVDPDALGPVLDVAVELAKDRTEGVERRAQRLQGLRFDMERALKKFLAGGVIP